MFYSLVGSADKPFHFSRVRIPPDEDHVTTAAQTVRIISSRDPSFEPCSSGDMRFLKRNFFFFLFCKDIISNISYKPRRFLVNNLTRVNHIYIYGAFAFRFKTVT